MFTEQVIVPLELSSYNKKTTVNYFAGSRKIARKEGSILNYVHDDNLGSAVLFTDTAGNAVPGSQISYDAFGSSPSDGAEFTGKKEDAGTGLVYFGARYYDPSIGRFISADSLPGKARSPQTLNRYSYAINNPNKFVDPDGNQVTVSPSMGSVIGQINSEVMDYMRAPPIPFVGVDVDSLPGYSINLEGSNDLGKVWYGGKGNAAGEMDVTVDVTAMANGALGKTNIHYTGGSKIAFQDWLKAQPDSLYREIDSVNYRMTSTLSILNKYSRDLVAPSKSASTTDLSNYYYAYVILYHEYMHGLDYYAASGYTNHAQTEINAFSEERNFIDSFMVPKINQDAAAGTISQEQAARLLRRNLPIWRTQIDLNLRSLQAPSNP